MTLFTNVKFTFVNTLALLIFLSSCSSDGVLEKPNSVSLSYIGENGRPLVLSNHEGSKSVVDNFAEFRANIGDGTEQYTIAEYNENDNSLNLKYKNSWYSTLSFDFANEPVDLSEYVDAGTLELEIKVDEVQRSGLNVVVACGDKCAAKIRLREWTQTNDGSGWHKLSFPFSCFVRPNADFSHLSRPFTLEADGNGSTQIRNVKFVKKGRGNFTCPDSTLISVTPDVLNEYWAEWWMPRHEEKLQLAKTGKYDLVLIGDSITHNWETTGKEVWDKYFSDIKSLNLGFSGDRTENVLWRIQHNELDGLNPKLAVLMIGTNNTGARFENPKYIVNGIRDILEELNKRLPNTTILLLKIFPRGETATDSLRLNNNVVNDQLPGLAKQYNVILADFNADFLEEDGTLSKTIMPDLLHPNATGYDIWSRNLEVYVNKYIRDAK